jgi:hypothetical protein
LSYDIAEVGSLVDARIESGLDLRHSALNATLQSTLTH